MYSYIIEDIKVEQNRIEDQFLAFQNTIDKAAAELYNTNKDLAIQFLSHYSHQQAEYVHKE